MTIHTGYLDLYTNDTFTMFFNVVGFLSGEIDNEEVQVGLYNNVPFDGYWRIFYEAEESMGGINFQLSVLHTEFLGVSYKPSQC